ncbi:MAG TPA: type II toxin-antitoxin system Phd/YefM family antitoxin [Longimicrobiaceae bacterium]|nr:type II toxin-antitoxin system Phd/YefM family antitoxin [Longimicrobiaceae bacterium]
MATVITADEARDRFDEIVGRVHENGETVILESLGEAMAAVVPAEMYERFFAEREARFAALDRFRASLPDYDEDEVLADATEAVAAVRRGRADGRPG